MQCYQCGAQFADGMPNCPNCNAPASNQFPGGGQGYGVPQNLTKKEFLHHPNLKKCSGNIKASAIILYVCAAFSLAVGFFMSNYAVLVDVLIIVGLALGIQLAQSRVCAILICIYAAFNVIYMTISSGHASGYLILIVAIDAIIATFQFQKAWKNYQKTGVLPPAK